MSYTLTVGDHEDRVTGMESLLVSSVHAEQFPKVSGDATYAVS